MNFTSRSSELTLNIISETAQEQLTGNWAQGITLSPRTIEEKLTSKILRLNHEKIRIACQIIGCKPSVAKSVSDSILSYYEKLASSLKEQIPNTNNEKLLIYTTNEKFIQLLKTKLAEYSITKPRSIFDFEVGLSIIEQSMPMIVLLGGTSGSGKSTVASLLASRFGISTVLSTDSIRHIMRNFMTTDECPVLFASTYNAGEKIKVEEGTTDRKRVILGFNQQSSLVQESLDKIIEGTYNKGGSIIIEGVHLTPDFMASIIAKYHNCIPFLVYIRSEKKHRERFAVRSKYMTLEKKHNKYIQNFSHIREIQKHLTKKADQNLVPKVNNSNIDKSLGLIHRTIIRCLRRVATGESLYDPEKKNAIKIYNQFNEVTKNIWSSDTVKQYISSKMSQANKKELVESFLFQVSEEKGLEYPPETTYQQADETINHGDNEEKEEEKDEEPEPTEEEAANDKQKTAKSRYKEDLLFEEDDEEGHVHGQDKKKNFRNHKKGGNNEVINGNGIIVEEEEDPSNFNNRTHFKAQTEKYLSVDDNEVSTNDNFTIHLKSPKSDDEYRGTRNISPDVLERAAATGDEKRNPSKGRKIRREASFPRQTSGNTSTFIHSKKQIKFNELENLLLEKKLITLKATISISSIRLIQSFVEYFQRKNPEFILRVAQQSHEKVTLLMQSKAEVANSPSNHIDLFDNSAKTPVLRLSSKTASTFSKGFYSERKSTNRMNESGTSEGEIDRSEDEGSMHSDVSGSLDANFHLTGRGSNTVNLSDHFDFSDDFDSTAKFENTEESDGRTSLEIVESANSISEQSDEDDDEDEGFVSRPAKLVK